MRGKGLIGRDDGTRRRRWTLCAFGKAEQNHDIKNAAIRIVAIGQKAVDYVAVITNPYLEVGEQTVEDSVLQLGHRWVVKLLARGYFKHFAVHLRNVFPCALARGHIDALVAVGRHAP